jgi:hypothetical protein
MGNEILSAINSYTKNGSKSDDTRTFCTPFNYANTVGPEKYCVKHTIYCVCE